MSRLLYVAEPLDQAFGLDRSDLDEFCRKAVADGWVVYRPGRAFQVDGGIFPGPEIERVNREALSGAGAMVAWLPRGVPTIGTPREVEYASRNSITTVVVTDMTGSWSLPDVLLFPEFETAFDYLSGLELSRPIEVPQAENLVFTLTENGQLPTRAYADDAGFDLYVAETVHIEPHSFRDVSCGIRLALPDGVWARITGRSSTLRKRGLLVAEGVIDGGYRGRLYAGVWNLTDEVAEVMQGDRVAQMLLAPNIAPLFRPVAVSEAEFENIPHDGRSSNGFGSSGV